MDTMLVLRMLWLISYEDKQFDIINIFNQPDNVGKAKLFVTSVNILLEAMR